MKNIGESMNVTEERAIEIIENLNRRFNVTPCELVVKPNLKYGRHAYYLSIDKTIFLDERQMTESILIHEYAHHLCNEIKRVQKEIVKLRRFIKEEKRKLKNMDFGFDKVVFIQKKRKTRKKRQRHHGKLFTKALKAVILAHFGSLEKYSCEREYINVIKGLRGKNYNVKEG